MLTTWPVTIHINIKFAITTERQAEIWSLDEPTTNCNYMAQNSKRNKKREWKTVHLLVCVFKETSKKNLMIN